MILCVYAKVEYWGEVSILRRQVFRVANVEQEEGKKQISKLYNGSSMYWLEFQKNVQGQQPAVLLEAARRWIWQKLNRIRPESSYTSSVTIWELNLSHVQPLSYADELYKCRIVFKIEHAATRNWSCLYPDCRRNAKISPLSTVSCTNM
jgi:hypothetical protein